MGPGESVVVDREPFGSSSFAMCRAVLHEDGSLTVRAIENGYLMQTFKPGTWSHARGVGRSGLEFYQFRPSDVQPALTGAER